MKSREGDLIETWEGLIFDVKGLVHPPNRIVAFVRYFPDEKGDRKKDKSTYSKVYSLSERHELLQKKWPKYLVYDPVFDETISEVSVDDVKRRYDPVERLGQLRNINDLDSLEGKALKLAILLKENSNIPWSAIGISGSILAGLHGANSDIDPIVFGSANCRRVHATLQDMLSDPRSPIKLYDTQDLKGLFDFRSKDTAMVFEDFIRTESRKTLQGKFTGTDYFIRFVKDWNEIDEQYGDVQYKNLGYAKIRATIAGDSESIFTPCRYTLENVTVIDGTRFPSITEIASFRGRFCEQARKGETVVAQGKVERITDLKRNRECSRLLIGNRPSDHMVLM